MNKPADNTGIEVYTLETGIEICPHNFHEKFAWNTAYCPLKECADVVKQHSFTWYMRKRSRKYVTNRPTTGETNQLNNVVSWTASEREQYPLRVEVVTLSAFFPSLLSHGYHMERSVRDGRYSWKQSMLSVHSLDISNSGSSYIFTQKRWVLYATCSVSCSSQWKLS